MEQSDLIRTFALNQGTALKATRVPKARFLELPTINAQRRKLLTDDVEDVTLLAIFNTDTVHIPEQVTDEATYAEVYFFNVTLKKDTHLGELHQLLHQTITNPAVIFYTLEGKVAISAAPKRHNKTISGQTVAEIHHLTPWLSPAEAADNHFLKAGAVSNCSFMNLERFYLDITAYVRHAELLTFSPTVVINRRRDWTELEVLLQKYRFISAQVRQYAEEERTHTAFGDKLSFRSKQVVLEKQKTELKLNIQEKLEKTS
jgi:hypothetical protein